MNSTHHHTQKLPQWPVWLLLMVLFAPVKTLAQQAPFYTPTVVNNRVRQREIRDSLRNYKHPGRRFVELGVAELVPWTVDRAAGKDYANISWKTVGYNLNPGHWAWDNDPFQTNQFGHPYHGSYFFNSFRTNGYSFWQSVPAAFLGSYIWETFAENQAPAPNDFINTSFGGIVLGEMTYRMSNKIVNNHTRGFHRQMSEVVAFIVCPTNGLNRILDGKWGKVSRNTLEVDSSKVSAEFDLGYRKFGSNNQALFSTAGRSGWYAHAKLLYGTPYENFRKPFTNIIINAEIGKDDSTALNMISVYGSLMGWQLDSGEEVKHLLVISANYDYIHNVAFFYGGQSVKLNLYSQFQPFKKIKLNTQLSGGPIILAAVPSPYLVNGRNYDYGSGLGIGGGGKLSLLDKFFVSVNYRGGWTHTMNGSKSHYFLHTISSEFSYMPIKGFSANAEPGYFTLEGHYKDHPEVNRSYPYLKLSARYAVNIR
ncbi:MAG: DUF3943 domain-containing protein [Bacteroidota bacterium]